MPGRNNSATQRRSRRRRRRDPIDLRPSRQLRPHPQPRAAVDRRARSRHRPDIDQEPPLTSPTPLAEPAPTIDQANINHSAPPDVRVAVAGMGRAAARKIAQGLNRQAKADAAAQRVRTRAEADKARADAAAHQRDLHARRQEESRARRRARRAALARRVGSVLAGAHRQEAAVYSLLVYAVVVYVAATSQMQWFHQQLGWSWSRALGAAVFLEGLGLAFALTAHGLRLVGERARVSRTFTWVAALFAAGMNYSAHVVDPALSPWMAQLQAIALGASSLAAIVLWEVRSGARARSVLRRDGRLPLPKPALGWDFFLRFPVQAFWAWSAMVDDPTIRTRRKAIKRGRMLWSVRLRIWAGRWATLRWWAAALFGRGRGQRRGFLAELRKAARAAAAHGDAGPALVYLVALSAGGHGSTPGGGAALEGVAPTGSGGGEPGAEAAGCGCAATAEGITAALRALSVQVDRLGQLGDGPEGGPLDAAFKWLLQVDELERAFRAPDGSELPVPGRPAVMKRMARLHGARFAWTSHEIVDRARKDLVERRASRFSSATPGLSDGSGSPP